VRVLFNTQVVAGRPTGVGQYAAQLVRALRRIDGLHVSEFPPSWLLGITAAARRLRSLAGAHGTPPVSDNSSWRPDLLGWLRRGGEHLLNRQFRRACASTRPDLYHEPNFIPLPTDLPTVVTVHDLSPLLHPEWHPADRVALYERRFAEGLRQCAHIIADSECIRQEILNTFHLPPERVTTALIGVRTELHPLPEATIRERLQALRLPPRYLLSLGTIEPRKNLLRLLRVYCSLPELLRTRYPLVLVGGWGWNAGDVAEYLRSVARHRGVIHLGYVGEADLAVLYNGARALLYPSYYEGFGLPPLEMLACGGAVLASTAAALVETVGGTAHLIPADDDDGWREAMVRVIEEDDWWRELRTDALATAKPYTWERCALLTANVYQQARGERPTREIRSAA
jgi:alpha-1,3-rhamnosyl/mannosyltransferase